MRNNVWLKTRSIKQRGKTLKVLYRRSGESCQCCMLEKYKDRCLLKNVSSLFLANDAVVVDFCSWRHWHRKCPGIPRQSGVFVKRFRFPEDNFRVRRGKGRCLCEAVSLHFSSSLACISWRCVKLRSSSVSWVEKVFNCGTFDVKTLYNSEFRSSIFDLPRRIGICNIFRHEKSIFKSVSVFPWRFNSFHESQMLLSQLWGFSWTLFQ